MASLVPSTGGGIVDVLYENANVPWSEGVVLTQTPQQFINLIEPYTFVLFLSGSNYSHDGTENSILIPVSQMISRITDVIDGRMSIYQPRYYAGVDSKITINTSRVAMYAPISSGTTGYVKLYGIR